MEDVGPLSPRGSKQVRVTRISSPRQAFITPKYEMFFILSFITLSGLISITLVIERLVNLLID